MPVTANVISSPILVTLMMEALSSSETSVLTRATRRNFPEDAIIYLRYCLSCSVNRVEGVDFSSTVLAGTMFSPDAQT
jgi:hypothetical protein